MLREIHLFKGSFEPVKENMKTRSKALRREKEKYERWETDLSMRHIPKYNIHYQWI